MMVVEVRKVSTLHGCGIIGKVVAVLVGLVWREVADVVLGRVVCWFGVGLCISGPCGVVLMVVELGGVRQRRGHAGDPLFGQW